MSAAMNGTSRLSPYGGEFFDWMEDGSLASARAIVPIIRNLIPFQSVVDVGCGRGAWLSVFRECGAETIVGYDGDYVDRSRLLIPSNCFYSADLARGIETTESFDLAVCLEVGEHLPRASSPRLIADLTRMAPAILFSAAIPGQGGTHHINEQWPQFWERRFADHGFEKLDSLRPRVWREPDVAWWYKQNAFLYVRRDIIKATDILRQELELTVAFPFELIHSSVLSRYNGALGLLKSLPGAIGRALRGRILNDYR